MENHSSFATMRFYNTDQRGREFGVLLAKGTYTIEADGTMQVAECQDPLVLTDTYHGALNVSALRMPSDLVPYKPRTDIIFDAVARAPGGVERRAWMCSIRVEGRTLLEKHLRVSGARCWEPTSSLPTQLLRLLGKEEGRSLARGWQLSEPDPVLELPLRYEYAYGGFLTRTNIDLGEPRIEVDHHNPIGRGWLDPDATARDQPVPAPQIEAPDEPIISPYQAYKPQGVGPIPPAWLPRRPLGGTYDDH